MKLRYSLSLLRAQAQALFHRMIYQSRILLRLARFSLQTFGNRGRWLARNSIRFIFTYFKHIVWIILGFMSLLVLVSLIYRYSVSYSTQFYHQLFYIEPFLERFTQHAKPIPTPSAPTPLVVIPYEVVQGDTYWDIAKKTGIDLDTLISYNNPKDIFKVRPRETLYIPIQDGIVYQRKPTETPKDIGTHYGIDYETILYFNPDWETRKTLFIPGAYFSYVERLQKLGAEFANPLKFFRLTSSFGNRIHPLSKKRSFHKGVDLGATVGTLVYAASGGRVVVARAAHGYGNVVMIHHGNNKFTKYGHLLDFSVNVGQKVVRGQPIGRVGSSGLSTGPHLHFEVWKQNKPINPIGVTDFFSSPKKRVPSP